MNPLKISKQSVNNTKFNFFNHQKKPNLRQRLYKYKILILFLIVLGILMKIFSFLSAETEKVVPATDNRSNYWTPAIVVDPHVAAQPQNIYYKSSLDIKENNKKIISKINN